MGRGTAKASKKKLKIRRNTGSKGYECEYSQSKNKRINVQTSPKRAKF